MKWVEKTRVEGASRQGRALPGFPAWWEVKVEGAAVLLFQPSRLIRPPAELLASKEPGEQIIPALLPSGLGGGGGVGGSPPLRTAWI